MTTVRCDLYVPSAAGNALIVGALTWTPTQPRVGVTAGTDVAAVAAKPFTVALDGLTVPSIVVDGTGATWCWKVEELIPGGRIRYVAVPATGTVDYGSLADVDPQTLAPVPTAEAAWTAALAVETSRAEAAEALLLPTATAMSTYAAQSMARPGNRIATLGDSTVRGVYNGDSTPGLVDSGTTLTVFIAADSWITWAQALSAGAIDRVRNGGVIGDTMALMDARVSTDIINQTPKPNACIVYSGYNDAYASVTPASYLASLTSIVGKLRAAGIVPIVTTPLPTVNSAPIAALLVQYGLTVRKYAADQGLILLDFQGWATDPATGGLIAAIGTGGDGVHPSGAGQKYLGQKVATALAPYLAAASSPLQIGPLDTVNIAPNGLFTGTPVAGLAPSVFVYGAAQTGVTPSVVTDPLVPGSMQRATHAGSTVMQSYAQRINQPGWALNDVLEFSGVITTSGITAAVQIQFDAPPYQQQAIQIWHDATRAYFCSRIPVPSATGYPTHFDVMLNSGPGTGTADFGQLTIRNLTALGLV